MKRKHSEGTEAEVTAVTTEVAEISLETKATETPTPAPVPAPAAAVQEGAEVTFQSLGLDARLLQGIAKLGFSHPTAVQAKAIALALEGKDILGRLTTLSSGGEGEGGS